ncbi:MAG: HU family DNA-binding protein [Egibacteraceae bacterium]
MNKGELIAAVAERSGAPRVTVEAILNGLCDTIGARLAMGERVTIPGFGTFESRHRAARGGMNPATGARIQIAATTVPAFRAGQTLRGRVASAPIAKPDPELEPAMAVAPDGEAAAPKTVKKKKSGGKDADKSSDKAKKRKKK